MGAELSERSEHGSGFFATARVVLTRASKARPAVFPKAVIVPPTQKQDAAARSGSTPAKCRGSRKRALGSGERYKRTVLVPVGPKANFRNDKCPAQGPRFRHEFAC